MSVSSVVCQVKKILLHGLSEIKQHLMVTPFMCRGMFVYLTTSHCMLLKLLIFQMTNGANKKRQEGFCVD